MATKAKKAIPANTQAGNDLTEKTVKVIPEFKIVKAVSLPTRKWEKGETIFVEFIKPIEIRQTVDPKDGKEKDIEVAVIRDLQEDDSNFDLVCGTVLKKEMDLMYDADSYKGKTFKITKHPVPNKRYNTFEIYEIEV